MKYLKKYQLFLEDDGCAFVDAGTAGMGNVINSQPGIYAGTTGTVGSGDTSFGLNSFKRKKNRKKKNRKIEKDFK